MVVLKLRKQTRPRRADPMRQPPTLVLLLSDNIMNIFLWMDVKVRDNACTLIPGENVVTLFLTSGVVTFTSPNPECSHVFYMCTRFQICIVIMTICHVTCDIIWSTYLFFDVLY